MRRVSVSNKIFSKEWLSVYSTSDRKKSLTSYLSGRTPVVVLLDDESDFVEVLKELVSSFGVDVFATIDPNSALDYLKANRSKVLTVISDYKMPSLTGFDFAKSVKQISGDIPFLILSGFVTRELALEGMALGLSGFLEKPVNVDDLAEVFLKNLEIRLNQLKDECEMLFAFLDDADGLLEQMEENLLALESSEDGDSDALERMNYMYGLLHTIKGTAGFFEPRSLHQFAHLFEDQIKMVQTGEATLSSERVGAWLSGLDMLKLLVDQLRTGDFVEQSEQDLLKAFRFEARENSAGAELYSKEPISPTAVGEKKSIAQQKSEIKVSMKLLDEFMQVSGEMTVIRNMTNKSVMALEKRYPSDKDVLVLSELLSEMHKINSDVQSKITDIRKVAIRNVLKPLQRTARDTAKALNKEIRFISAGDDLRIDNSIAEILSHTLIHLLRNCIDHGLETKAERMQTKKDKVGSISVSFIEENEHIIARIQDDGQGVNTDKLRAKAIEKGLRTSEEAKAMSDKEVYQMIFEAGFSTAEVTTEFSGRGVGMSMVKETIEAAGGAIDIHSEKGIGSVFSIKLPIPKSALIASCLFVEDRSGRVFGLPQSEIERVIDRRLVHPGNLNAIGGANYIRIEGDLVPLIDLSDLIDSPEPPEIFGAGYFVVVGKGSARFALKVMEIQEVEDSVIKPIQVEAIRNLKIFLGGTFLSDGSVGLVLSVPGISDHLDLAGRNRPSESVSKSEISNMEGPLATRRYINFRLNVPGVYALSESEIYRIEEFSLASLQTSNSWLVTPYQTGLLYFVSASDLAATETLVPYRPEQKSDVVCLIIKVNQLYVGLVVPEILDLVEVPLDEQEPLKVRQACKPHLMLGDQVVTPLNVEYLQVLVSKETLGEVVELSNSTLMEESA